ncbi:NAD-dependent succinate-semialdehyde dehydrogenase [Phyllobacterium endophyticum]|uniref:Succinate-semialdehyde dehydrogenase (NADP(+)) n=1 Tax=Phyllobacterium endophyticum TaxID=1149773 RepID=A0A2P7AR90_9HYPH|nr:NAD-dependent succinate-semialdehyde dehydrogenase [Phyllobacterium endophyticum]MBB3237426.1 succinate-semialdehyde dehydrogenase/glutarate-semialdehyde dehydrogenase [Phyllobacterium endophyticum]PSH56756.1 succinate-semialdehyde dehydrogenase (NADP(+)) [Phyllobacterium endophyticum]TYR44260.1 NAD-dependent succinate-semialdehyde dehydrogenase [Phyllobacterium endophyticum]
MLNLKDPSLFVQQALIDGNWTGASSGATVTVDNPATGDFLGTVPDCGKDDSDRAIAAAAAAFKTWRLTTAAERARLLDRWHDLLLENTDDLALIMTCEQGKPLAEARGEILYGASFIKWFAEEARRSYGMTIPAPTVDRRILVSKEPVGVAAIITPWNFPNAMITRKCAPALAAGCTVVIKPSELTPYSALALGLLAERAGIPPGVINIVTGLPKAIGASLTSSPDVRKVSFTGSTAVGSLLMAQCAATVKRLSLELGGNAPFIVFEDADLDAAVEAAIVSKFRNGGQTCVCANRLLVQDGIYDTFAGKLAARVRAMPVGSGVDDDIQIGPMINVAAVGKISAHIEDALALGAANITPRDGLPAGDRYVAPTVLTGATTAMRLASEETFGPVAPLFRFKTEAEAIAIANSTPYGLAAYFFTENLHRAWRVGEALEFGMVGLNTGSVSMEVAPFGGIKQSGLGREGGPSGMEEYLEIKAFHLGGLKTQPA